MGRKALAPMLWLVLFLAGCTTTGAPVEQDQLVTMAQQGASLHVMRMAVRNHGLAFPLSAANIVSLKQGGLTDEQLAEVLHVAVAMQNGRAGEIGEDPPAREPMPTVKPGTESQSGP